MFKAPRGTQDILPPQVKYYQLVEQKTEEVFELCGYQRVETPTFENAELFLRGVGEGTDVTDKEMYVFSDRSGNRVALRPEGTASVCRAYIEHGMHNLPQPVRLYYITPVFRYERPQAGRYREHHQLGAEAIGESDPALDVEVMDIAGSLLHKVGADFFLS